MSLFRTKFNIAVLTLSVVGSHLSAADAGYVAQAKQKASNARDWSVQAAGKAREKAKDVYAFTRQKTNALYEKAKENKRLIAVAVAYLGFEAVGLYQGWRTPGYRFFVLPGELDASNAANMNLNSVIIPGLNGQINTVNANLNTANTVTIPGLNNTINGHLATINIQATNIQNLINELADVRSRNNEALDMLEAQDAEVEKLQNQLAEVQLRNKEALDALDEHIIQIDELKNKQKKPEIEFVEGWKPPRNGKFFLNNRS